jgi:uncharacterized protein (TIGR00369 family)
MTSFQPKNPLYRELIAEKLKGQRFMHHVGMQLTKIEPGYVEATIDFSAFLEQQNGFLHGGVTATLCDVTAGFAAFSLVDADEGVVTGDLRVSYLNPGKSPQYLSKGWVIKTGRLLHFCESEVWGIQPNGEAILLAKSSSTMVTVKQSTLNGFDQKKSRPARSA